jgi:ferredoxin
MIQITHKRSDCIGCYACVEHAPSYWKMDEDGMASLLEVSHRHDQMEFGIGYDADRAELEQSVENCPVHIISIS